MSTKLDLKTLPLYIGWILKRTIEVPAPSWIRTQVTGSPCSMLNSYHDAVEDPAIESSLNKQDFTLVKLMSWTFIQNS